MEKEKIHRVEVLVTGREGVPSPSASSKNRALSTQGFDAEVLSEGRYFQLFIKALDRRKARAIAKGASEKLLANPVIEVFRILPLKSPSPRQVGPQ